MDPFQKSFRYFWLHVESGASGVEVWEGSSRQSFLEALAKWNRLGQIPSPHHWYYEEA